MRCICDDHPIGSYKLTDEYLIDTSSDAKYNLESVNEVRGKFAAILLWNPIQSIGHVALRIFHLFSGASFANGQEKANQAYYNRLAANPLLLGTRIKDSTITLYQLRELAVDITKLVMFIIFGIAARELTALLGIFYPLDGRVAYGNIESFFFSTPKDKINTKSYMIEFFSFSAPCMQPYTSETSLRKRRCEVLCTLDHIRYQPNSTLGKVHILTRKIDQCAKLYLTKGEEKELRNLVTKIKEIRQASTITVTEEIRYIAGKLPNEEPAKQILKIQHLACQAIDELEKGLQAWAHVEYHSFKPLFKTIQHLDETTY